MSHIVIRVTQTGKLSPSARPFIHHDPEDALNEAERLAAANPGEQFAVYSITALSVAPVLPVVSIVNPDLF